MQREGQGQRECMSGCLIGEEVSPECEVVLAGEGGELEARYRECKKNPNHPNFIKCSKFTVSDLPPENRTRRMMDEVFHRCVQTVRVKVPFISNDRPDKFADSHVAYPYADFKGSDNVVLYGTGKVIELFYPQGVEGKLCPCPLCKKSTRPRKFWWIRVRTATHVIYDRSEAQRASFECFYDETSDVEEKRVRTIYGFDTFNIVTAPEKSYRSDVCDVVCVTHDQDIASLLYKQLEPAGGFLYQPIASDSFAPSKIIVSHPHGCFKRITLGTVLHLTAPIGQNFPKNEQISFKGETVYRISSKTKTCGDTMQACNAQNWENHPSPDLKDNAEENQLKISKDKALSKTNSNNADKNVFITSEEYNLHEKLETLKKKLRKNSCSQPSEIEAEKESLENDTTDDDRKNRMDDYIATFYLTFLREQILMFLVICAVVRQKIVNPKLKDFPHLVENAFHDFFEQFINKKLSTSSKTPETNIQAVNLKKETESRNVTSVSDSLSKYNTATGSIDGTSFHDKFMTSNEITSDKEKTDNENDFKNQKENSDEDVNDMWQTHWDTLVEISEKVLAQFKSETKAFDDISGTGKNEDKSIILSIFIEIEQIMDQFRLQTKQNKGELNESILPLVFDRIFDSCSKIMEKFESKLASQSNESKKDENRSKTHQNLEEPSSKTTGNLQKLNAVPGNEMTMAGISQTEGVEEHENKDISNNGNSENIPQDKIREEIKVPVGSTFTLPMNATYAFRVYGKTPGWLSFPPGTKVTFPNGETIDDMGEPHYEFKVGTSVPDKSYVTYDINTCPGSSGATVYCENALGQNVTTFFPHSWRLSKGLNRSGVRESVYSLYSKLILVDSKQIMQGLIMTGCNTNPNHVPSLLEVSKMVAMTIRGILMKSLSYT